MINRNIAPDQSQFSATQEAVLPPPETIQPPPTPEQIADRKKKARTVGLIGGGLGLTVLLLALILVILPADAPPAPAPTATPIPPKQETTLETELKKMEAMVEEANPYRLPVEPPPVDMEVTF